MHTKPPSHRAGSVGARYYAELSRQIKHQLFRYWRVETVTPEKLAWLEKLIDEYRGNQKASLACMLPDKVGSPVPEVSVQIIDDHTAILVAMGDDLQFRDIIITNSKAVKICAEYYKRVLWRRSIEVVKSGTFNPDAWNKVKGCLQRDGHKAASVGSE